MKLIVGLGNPGNEYQKTRHNLGFEVVESLAGELEIDISNFQNNAIVGKKDDIWLIKPGLYMNLSGKAVDSVVKFYKLKGFELVIVHDELDLDLGDLRIQKSGGSAGHKGVASILEYSKQWDVTADWRVRLGIGRSDLNKEQVSNYVLEKVLSEEEEVVNSLIEKATAAVLMGISTGWDAAMNHFN